MALRGFDLLSANEFPALLTPHNDHNKNAHSMPTLLLAQQHQHQQLHQQLLHQQLLQQQQMYQQLLQQQLLQQQKMLQHQQQSYHSNFASLGALNSTNMARPQFVSMSQTSGSSQLAEQQYQPQTTQLLTQLLEQQKREDKRKADLIARLDNILRNSSHEQFPPHSESLAMLIHQKQMSLDSRSIGNTMPLLSGAPHLMGGSASIHREEQKTGGPTNAAAIAKLPQSQHDPRKPQMQLNQDNNLMKPAQQTPHSCDASCVPSVSPSEGSSISVFNASDRRLKVLTGTFQQKLHKMLSDLERQDGGTAIASFLPHGRAFAIHKPDTFVRHVMPKYFRMSRFSSFQRQLNLYDFQQITEGPDKGSYYHELFVQGLPVLSTVMKKNKIKSVKSLKSQEMEGHKPEE